ncbi:ATP-binding protein [Parapedobacter koreensis]|nr:ATP-binding protein [Parapedobacter koreensis]
MDGNVGFFSLSDTSAINQLNRTAATLADRQQFDSAHRLIQQAIVLSQDANYALGRTQAESNLARIYYMKGDYVRSLKFGLSSLHLAEQLNDKAEIAHCKNLVGLVHLVRGAQQLALQEFLYAAELNKTVGNDRRLAANYFNAGLAYSELGQTERAKEEFVKSKDFCEARGILHIAAMSTNRLAEVYFKQEQLDSALFFYRSVLENRRYQSDWENSFAHTGIAACLYGKGQYGESLQHAEKGLELAEKLHTKWDARQALTIGYRSSEALGDYKRAFSYLLRQKAYSDSLLNEDKNLALDSLHLAYERTVNESLKKENEIALQELKISKLLAGIAGLFLLFFVSVSILIYRNARRTKTLNTELAVQSASLAHQKQQLKEQNQVIMEQNQRLNELNETKDYLLSIISHDVRAPFASIIGILDILSNLELPVSEIRRLQEELYGQSFTALAMVNNLLYWAQSQQKGFSTDLVEINLSQKVEEILGVLGRLAEDKQIAILHASRKNAFILADGDQVNIILQNILGNAIKFTRPGGTIRIGYQTDEQSVSIRIMDDGIGMSEETVQQLLSDEESQVSTAGTANESGVGLGMMLVKRFIDKNGATLHIESGKEQGSTFTVTFKRASNTYF